MGVCSCQGDRLFGETITDYRSLPVWDTAKFVDGQYQGGACMGCARPISNKANPIWCCPDCEPSVWEPSAFKFKRASNSLEATIAVITWMAAQADEPGWNAMTKSWVKALEWMTTLANPVKVEGVVLNLRIDVVVAFQKFDQVIKHFKDGTIFKLVVADMVQVQALEAHIEELKKAPAEVEAIKAQLQTATSKYEDCRRLLETAGKECETVKAANAASIAEAADLQKKIKGLETALRQANKFADVRRTCGTLIKEAKDTYLRKPESTMLSSNDFAAALDDAHAAAKALGDQALFALQNLVSAWLEAERLNRDQFDLVDRLEGVLGRFESEEDLSAWAKMWGFGVSAATYAVSAATSAYTIPRDRLSKLVSKNRSMRQDPDVTWWSKFKGAAKEEALNWGFFAVCPPLGIALLPVFNEEKPAEKPMSKAHLIWSVPAGIIAAPFCIVGSTVAAVASVASRPFGGDWYTRFRKTCF